MSPVLQFRVAFIAESKVQAKIARSKPNDMRGRLRVRYAATKLAPWEIVMFKCLRRSMTPTARFSRRNERQQEGGITYTHALTT
jgi:hypothetical protein